LSFFLKDSLIEKLIIIKGEYNEKSN